ncbi:DEDD exonuclease domain-containing protein [Aldersonia sp. NBC_00410]|uniref:DEDD exonuclease domain-containing protein n=1 Tax=Aldersonia sp. NBC_00410 TaxID=2975954 RepID=UPI00225596F9|nr:DEDD exonuclease domain-containing protein [Aldersonia sp. NBC_00410]MCX5045946.1 DEDD exonuclease domain-containing protein [Aldersonia sp. NBC_00410]
MTVRRSATRTAAGQQLSFDELDVSLRDTTFVVVDLETTGGSAAEDAITEIGAVKVRGGEVLGELATLVDPGRSIPTYVVELTGITTAMVVGAPRIEQVLPSFLEFSRDCVLVAHNAGFDMSFLRAAAERADLTWPKPRVLCTVKLARRVLTREEAPSVRLSALASLFRVDNQPTHRALDDARATVEVLHELIGRVGNQGVHSYTELIDYLPHVSAGQRAKRFLAGNLPRTPGVYLFRGPSDEVLYIGTAVNLQRRVRNYFTGSETRGRMKEMVALATRIDHVECAHALEAGVRELRLLVAHAPPYNRRSKFPKRAWWISLTAEAFPRLSITRTAGSDALGPFGSRADAAAVADTIAEYCALRTCSRRIAHDGRHDCPAVPVGGCPASRPGAALDAETYRSAPEAVRALMTGGADDRIAELHDHIERLAADELFESAARLRDRAAALIRALRRVQRLAALATVEQLVAARPAFEGGWEFAVIRHGRLASAGRSPRGAAPMPVVEALIAAAETVMPDETPLRGAAPEEVALIARWLEGSGTRIVTTTEGYREPAYGAGRWLEWSGLAEDAAQSERRFGWDQ